MRKQYFFYLLYIFLFAFPAKSQQITESEALQNAKKFHNKSTSLSLAYTGGSASMPDFYVYNIADNGGYIIAAGDRRMADLIPVYAPEGKFDPQNLPDAFSAMLEGYSQLVNQVRATSANLKNQPRSATTASLKTKTGEAVDPLLKNIQWGQEAPYNTLCPIVGGVRSLTGCGATAASQVMKFYSWPSQGTGSKTYTENGKSKTINFGQQNYNWDLMLPIYNSNATQAQKDEVAKLMYHTGVSQDMRYSEKGSGTSILAIYKALPTYFKYSTKLQNIYRLAYTDSQWIATLKREFDLGRPVIYSGLSNDGGHLFVCDGYDSNDRLHVNYGWDGYTNAFVALSAIAFPLKNQALIGIYPNDKTYTDDQQAAPQIVLLSPLHCTQYTPALGTAFNVGFRVSNYSKNNFSGNLAIALFNENEQMVGSPLKQQQTQLPGSEPAAESSANINESDILFQNVVLPQGTPDGQYRLGLVSQLGSAWYPALAQAKDVVRMADVTIKSGTATISYPYSSTQVELQLIKPIEVDVRSNRATVRFSVRNVDNFYKSISDLSVMAVADNNPIPVVWKRVATIDTLIAGGIQEFEVTDLAVPSGKTCRFYVATNHIQDKPNVNRDIASVPLLPLSHNFKPFSIPAETEIKLVDFYKETIPTDYKQYLSDGTPSLNEWSFSSLLKSNATSKSKGSRLVTSGIPIPDESMVMEWAFTNMYSSQMPYTIYISTNGQEFEKLGSPVYHQTFPDKGVARFSLADYAGKTIYIGFEAPINGACCLQYFKLLSIKNPKDISVEEVVLSGAVKEGENNPVKVRVKNLSAASIKTFSGSYTVNGTTVKQDFDADIAFGETKEYEFSTPITVTGTAGDVIPVKVHVEQEGEEEAQKSNNDKEAQFMVVNFHPTKRGLVYKTAKLQCPGCMMKYVVLDDMEKAYPESFSGIEIWRDGTFKTTDFPTYISGSTPNYFLNGVWKPTDSDVYNSLKAIDEIVNPPANVSAKIGYEDNSRVLNIALEARFALPSKGEYRLGAIVIENNAIDCDKQTYGSAPTGEKLTKNHVIVGVIGSYDGSTGHIIQDPKAEKYNSEFKFNIPAETAYRYKKENIQVIAVLYNGKGEILNTALNSYYLKLPKTEGLTFNAAEGCPAFKLVYDLEAAGPKRYDLTSVSNYRAIVEADSTFSFTIEQDSSWNGKLPKVILNKTARYNQDKEEILIPDAKGVYTLSNVDRPYFVTIEKTDAPTPVGKAFEVKLDEKVLSNGDTVEVKSHSEIDGKLVMKFAPQVTNTSSVSYSMRLIRKEMVMAPNSESTLCWDTCTEAVSDTVTAPAPIQAGDTANPYGQLTLNAKGNATNDTTVIRYTFETDDKTAPTLTVTARFVPQLPVPKTFEITHNGTVLKDGDVVTVTSFTDRDGKRSMKFEPSVKNTSSVHFGMKLTKEEYIMVPNTASILCWGTCTEATDTEVIAPGGISASDTHHPYGELILNAIGNAETGTSTIFYTFATDDKAGATLTVTVHFNYERPVGMEETIDSHTFVVWTENGSILIKTGKSASTLLYGSNGSVVKQLKLNPGINRVNGLPKGVYLINGRKVIL